MGFIRWNKQPLQEKVVECYGLTRKRNDHPRDFHRSDEDLLLLE